ncbi:MAG: biopolymer transporter ExbD [Betaproteobacteria bacterium]|nr:biopolymer transporter ExbD [Betaproteobacteria bacterium]
MRTFPDFAVKKARIEVIPMIDVMMFLLVFFVLISINVIPAGGLKVALPSLSTLEKNIVPKKIIITITKDSRLMLDDAPIILGDLELALLNKKNQLGSNFTVVINGDEAASLQDLVAVMEVLKNLQIPSMTISSKKRS